VLDVLEEFELAIGALAEDWRAEGLHDLLNRNRGTCELILGRAGDGVRGGVGNTRRRLTRQDRRHLGTRVRWSRADRGIRLTHADGLEVDISGGDLGKGE
jgi:hypothetical protein